MTTAEPEVLEVSGAEDAKSEEREGAEPITIRTPGLPKLPPLTVEQAEELSQILAH